jgi:uncharacterized cupredoxin-like copper-binding protein
MTMTDNAFTPRKLQVPKGATITFVFNNEGSVAHEAVIGDDSFQEEHHAAMSGDDDGAMDHGEMSEDDDTGSDASASDAITVEPGQSGRLTHTFTDSGSVIIGCHEPGHWEDGMKATVNVS